MADPQTLAEPLRSITIWALEGAQDVGRSVTVTSAKRSTEEQIQLRRQNCGTSQFAIFEASPSTCSPATARPGQSKHETGQAVDIGGDNQWFADKVRPLNVVRTVTSEPWHFEYRGSDPAADLAQIRPSPRTQPSKLDATYDNFREGQRAPSEGDSGGGGGIPATATAAGWAGSIAGTIAGGAPGYFVDFATAVGSVLDQITGVFGPLGEGLGAVGRFLQAVMSPSFWAKVGWVILGIVLVLIGVGILLSGTAKRLTRVAL